MARRAETLFGGTLLPQSRLLAVFSALSVGLVCGITAFLLSASYVRRMPAVGWLIHEPGDAEIRSPRAGTIARLWAADGQLVKVGAPLVQIDTGRSFGDTPDAEERILAKLSDEQASLAGQIVTEQTLLASNRKVLRRGIDDAERKIAALGDLRAVAQRRLDLADADAHRLSGLAEKGYVARNVRDSALNEALAARMALGEIEQREREALGELTAKRVDFESAPLRAQQRIAELRGAQSRIEQQIVEARSAQSTLVRAPIAGRVANVVGRLGETVAGGSALLTVVPEDAVLRAELFVSTRAAGFVAHGAVVHVRYDAFPFQQFGQHAGTVASVDRGIVMPGMRSLPFTLSEPSYRVSLTLSEQSVAAYGQKFELRSGMTLRADILQERRRLVDWVLDPMYAMASRS